MHLLICRSYLYIGLFDAIHSLLFFALHCGVSGGSVSGKGFYLTAMVKALMTHNRGVLESQNASCVFGCVLACCICILCSFPSKLSESKRVLFSLRVLPCRDIASIKTPVTMR